MKKFVISFYIPGEHNELIFLAKAGAEGKDAYEAAPKACAELKEAHPEIKEGYWLAMEHYGSLEPEKP